MSINTHGLSESEICMRPSIPLLTSNSLTMNIIDYFPKSGQHDLITWLLLVTEYMLLKVITNSSSDKPMGPLQDSDHMVQKPPYWDANCPLGHLKQRKFRLTSFVLDVPVRNLRPSMAVFVPCDHYPAKGPLRARI